MLEEGQFPAKVGCTDPTAQDWDSTGLGGWGGGRGVFDWVGVLVEAISVA